MFYFPFPFPFVDAFMLESRDLCPLFALGGSNSSLPNIRKVLKINITLGKTKKGYEILKNQIQVLTFSLVGVYKQVQLLRHG